MESISDTTFNQNLHFCFLLFRLCVDPFHTYPYKNSNTNKHKQTFEEYWRAPKSNKHYRIFIDCLTNKLKCYSTTSPYTFGAKTGLFWCIEYLVPVLISNSLITSSATSIVFTQQMAFMSFPKTKMWEDDALPLIYWKKQSQKSARDFNGLFSPNVKDVPFPTIVVAC